LHNLDRLKILIFQWIGKKSVRRPFGFISFLSEKTAEEVLRQQRHVVNGISIEVRPAKPRAHEQQMQIQQHQYQYAEPMLSHHYGGIMQQNSTATMMGVHASPAPFYSTNSNYAPQMDQWSQGGIGVGAGQGGSYWSSSTNDIRGPSLANSALQWSTGINGGLSSSGGNNGVYGGSGNSVPSASSLYHHHQQQQQQQQHAMYNPGGLTQQSSYGPSSVSSHQSYGGPSSSSYGGGYASSSSSTMTNEASSSSSSWNPHVGSGGLNGVSSTNYDPNMYYYYANMAAQQFYQQHQQLAIDPSMSSNDGNPSSNGGPDNNYQQHSSR